MQLQIKKDSYILLVKTIVSWLILCLKKKGVLRDVIAPMSELPLVTLLWKQVYFYFLFYNFTFEHHLSLVCFATVYCMLV